ncbi:MAG: (d)CMP kinase [Hyphomicrobiaceae bacterium]
MIIAIDGPAASGKGTLAALVAEHLGYDCLDTGLLYRAVARDVRAKGGALTDESVAAGAATLLDITTLDDAELKAATMGEAASVVAGHPAVRAALLDLQREFAHRPPGVVIDGRDIGTVVCPDADVKIFVTADLEVRAQRRFDELVHRGERVTFEGVLDVIRKRDARDRARTVAPMRPASDAVVLDTTGMTVTEAFRAALDIVAKAAGSPS